MMTGCEKGIYFETDSEVIKIAVVVKQKKNVKNSYKRLRKESKPLYKIHP